MKKCVVQNITKIYNTHIKSVQKDERCVNEYFYEQCYSEVSPARLYFRLFLGLRPPQVHPHAPLVLPHLWDQEDQSHPEENEEVTTRLSCMLHNGTLPYLSVSKCLSFLHFFQVPPLVYGFLAKPVALSVIILRWSNTEMDFIY